MTSVTCNNVRMVTMEGCVDVVGVAGRYLGLEEPVKLIRGWVLLAVSFPRAQLPAAHVWAAESKNRRI